MNGVPRETELSQRYADVPGMGRFAQILATTGVERGLIGPREVPRLWSRHLVNCAVVAQAVTDLLPVGCSVADVGSGAGLPGIAWSLVRPDLRMTLIEPLLRRSTFLSEVVDELSLAERVDVVRCRAEDTPHASFEVVTARAVARLPQLLAWTLPLAQPGGRVLALKGSAARDEVAEVAPSREALGAGPLTIRHFGVGIIDPPTIVVVAPRSG